MLREMEFWGSLSADGASGGCLFPPGVLSARVSYTLGSGQLCLQDEACCYFGLQAGHRAALTSWSCVSLLWVSEDIGS